MILPVQSERLQDAQALPQEGALHCPMVPQTGPYLTGVAEPLQVDCLLPVVLLQTGTVPSLG